MAIDASIYQSLRPVQMPSPLESRSRALQVTGQTMQNVAAAKQLQAADRDEAVKAQKHRISVIGSALENIAELSEQERAAAYPKMREGLINQGVIRPQDAPEQYDPGLYRQTLMGWRNSDEYLNRQEKLANIAKLKAEAQTKANPAKKEFDLLAPENQKQIETLAQKSAGKTSIKNQIDSALEILGNPDVDEEQKVTAGMGLLKVLNSAEGADAIGVEEARRIGGLLEYKVLNFTEPGSFVGRDIDQFVDQVRLKSEELGQGIARNRAEIDKLYGRRGGSIPSIKVPMSAREKTSGMAKFLEGGSEARAAGPGKAPDFSAMSDDELRAYIGGS
jgi:hypothetical protein